jgi:ubiquinone/menaquinone biosynthesis C-methylase UbiE
MNPWRSLYFNLIAPGYALVRRPGAVERALVRRLLAPPPAGRLLEVGAGAGYHARDLLRHHPELTITAVEPAFLFRLVNAAAARAAGLSGRLTQLDGAVELLPCPAGAFDAALCLFVLWAVEDRAQAVAELGRVVKPGGRLVIAEFAKPAPFAVRPDGRPEKRGVRLPFGHAPLEGPEELSALLAPDYVLEEQVRQPHALFASFRRKDQARSALNS